MKSLIHEILRRAAVGEPLAFCSVVRTRGSTPQGAGAAMLVLANGQTLGTLGGGCVEADVRQRALRLMQANASRLLTFKLNHDFGWDDGLVCGGTMEIAVQSISGPVAIQPWQAMIDKLSAGQSAELILSVPDETGTVQAFRSVVPATPSLVIIGAGHVGKALAILATRLDFAVTVIDDRADLLTPDGFPGCRTIVGDIEGALSQETIDEQTYIVVVTRGHKHDGQALLAVIRRGARYVGMIGSKRKVKTIFDELYAAGVSVDLLRRVHSPIGLEIGAITPAEIAVSIVAELIAVRRGRENMPAAPMTASPQVEAWLTKP